MNIYTMAFLHFPESTSQAASHNWQISFPSAKLNSSPVK